VSAGSAVCTYGPAGMQSRPKASDEAERPATDVRRAGPGVSDEVHRAPGGTFGPKNRS